VARHLGIAESTLRSWHRRYGIGPQGSRPGRYRRYSEEDVARLRRMLDLIGLGMLASEAARTVQAGEFEPVAADRDVADLITAARAADAERCRIVLDSVLARRGVVDGWDLVCRPALAAADADQRFDPDCMDIEHALSWAILGALHRIARPPISPGAVPVLLACVEAEHHTLPLAALAAALAAHRVAVHMLGAATPTPSLVRAVRDTAAGAVVLWSHRRDTAGPEVLRSLRRYPVRLYTAGPGWPAPPPAGTQHLAGLRAALDELVGPAPADPAGPAGPAGPGGTAGPGERLPPDAQPDGASASFPAGEMPPSGPVRSLQ
jgi:MerR family transcriptional regulator, light-induced transcriptional regulator